MAATVTVSERAARRIGEILTAEAPGTMLRVSVEGGGCSGFQYRFDMEQSQAPDDFVVSRNGATVLIDPISLRYMEGAEIDFVVARMKRRPAARNPGSRLPDCASLHPGYVTRTPPHSAAIWPSGLRSS